MVVTMVKSRPPKDVVPGESEQLRKQVSRTMTQLAINERRRHGRSSSSTSTGKIVIGEGSRLLQRRGRADSSRRGQQRIILNLRGSDLTSTAPASANSSPATPRPAMSGGRLVLNQSPAQDPRPAHVSRGWSTSLRSYDDEEAAVQQSSPPAMRTLNPIPVKP
jgi:hypothetical protein